MKKFLAMALTMVVAFGCAACGGSSDDAAVEYAGKGLFPRCRDLGGSRVLQLVEA